MTVYRRSVAANEGRGHETTQALLRACSTATMGAPDSTRDPFYDRHGGNTEAGRGQWAYKRTGGNAGSIALANALAWVGPLGDAPRAYVKPGKAPARKRATVKPVDVGPARVESHAEQLRRLARAVNEATTAYHAAILAAAEAEGVSAAARYAGWTRQGVYSLQARRAAA